MSIRQMERYIYMLFANEETVLMQEYFPDCPIEQISEDRKRMFIDVPAKERLWKALLLSFGNRIKVVGPEEYKRGGFLFAFSIINSLMLYNT